MIFALEWTITTWTAVSAVATALLAAGTFFAVLQGRNERKQIVADRELTWRPALSGEFLQWLDVVTHPGLGQEIHPILRNAGGGPALSARVLWLGRDGWIVSKPVDVAAHGIAHPTLTEPFDGTKEDAEALLFSIRTDDFRGALGAIVCRDFLDRRWCFPLNIAWDYMEGRAAHAEVLTPVFWRPTKRLWRAPAWAISKTLWPEGYALFIGQTA